MEGDGSGVEVSLGLVAAKGLEVGELVVGLDAFGDCAQSEGVGQRDDGGDDGFVVGVGGDAGHEGAVDLDDVDREPFEVGQGRVAGAEVVDGDADSEQLELVQGGDGVGGGVDESGLGELEAEQ